MKKLSQNQALELALNTLQKNGALKEMEVVFVKKLNFQ